MLAVFFASDIIGLLKQRRDLGITVPVMGVTGVTAAVPPDVLKDAAGTFVPESLPRELKTKDTPGIRELRKAVGVDEHGKEIGSLVYLSGGRFELGVGVGWDAHEFEVAGVPLAERGPRTDEILDIWAKLWAGQEVTHHGRFYTFERVAIDPPLPKAPRLWLAGGAKIPTSMSPDPPRIATTVLERIARRADGWLARGAPTR
jgi:hypothetical protein